MKICPICGKKNNKEIFSKTLLSCNDCSHVWANMNISESVLRKIYSENYFRGEEYWDYILDKNIIQKNFKKRLYKIKKLNPSFENILEIGCAYGFFFNVLNKQGLIKKYTGYDISTDAVKYAKENFGSYFSDHNFLSSAKPLSDYSDVFMWDVIEHLPDPSAFIQKISTETAHGSRIYITTGDIGALLPKIQKQKWRMIHPPTHLHYFTKQSLTLLLSHFGYKVEAIYYPTIFRSIKIIFYSLFLLNKKSNNINKYIFNKIPENISLGINTFDLMFVIARKA